MQTRALQAFADNFSLMPNRIAAPANPAHTKPMHGSHPAAHHHGHDHAPPSFGDRRYIIAIALNIAFVLIEAAAGIIANSTALLSDAAHNLSDVLGLALAGGAAWLAKRDTGAQRTYGFSKATILAALANGVILFGACGALLLETLGRLFEPQQSAPMIMVAVAAAGVLINGATAALFLVGRKHDVNVRGAFLHMLADAGVSAGVVVAGLALWWTGLALIDPIVSLLVITLILWGSWGLLKESLDLAMDAAPTHINVEQVRAFLNAQPGVTAVHDLHVWAMGATEPALTAHLVRPDGVDDEFLRKLTHDIEHRFGVSHVTLQIERTPHDCGGHN